MSRNDFIKMRGAWDIRHWLRIPELQSTDQVERITRALEAVPGMQTVLTYPNKRKIRVIYDQTKVNFDQILTALDVAGVPAADDWWSRVKAAWFDYLDRNAQINAHIPTSPCCSNPTRILQQSKQAKQPNRQKREH